MALILNIDTATELASICITNDGHPVASTKNANQKEHASFVHLAIQQLLGETKYTLKDFDAFAVTSGPGSYTGLRVAMATAKGFCYALSKPLITLNTLEVMTKAAVDATGETAKNKLFCPMIDARRMEVFTAIYNSQLQAILRPQPMVLAEKIFNDFLFNSKVLFFGNGSKKFSEIESNANSEFFDIQHDARNLGTLAEKAFGEKKFADISYAAPEYFKDFHSTAKNNN